MARCDCSGRTCNCLVIGGDGITVTGSGTTANPYTVTADVNDLRDLLRVNDTSSVNFTLVGSGTSADPLILSAVATPRLMDLSDVDDVGPLNGETIVWAGGGNGGWVFATPTTAAPGAVGTGPGLLGDGSLGNELEVAVSGEWGTGVLSGLGADSTVGLPIYVDSAGELRAQPVEAGLTTVSWESVTGKPVTFPPDIGTTATTAASGIHTHSWADIAAKPTTFPSAWATLADKPDFAATYATKPSTLNSRAVVDVNGNNAMGLRWNGTNPVVRVDASEWELARMGDINTLAATKATAIDHVDQAKYAKGTQQAHSREAGANRYAVWVDGGYVFGRATSSIRFKEDVQPWDLDPAEVLALEPVSFHRKVDEPDVRDHGLIAEEVNLHVPQIVQWWTDPDGDGTSVIDGIHYELLSVALLSVVKDQQSRIEDLNARLSTLEGTI